MAEIWVSSKPRLKSFYPRGTAKNPMALKEALSAAKPGDTLCLYHGVYKGSFALRPAPGILASAIAFLTAAWKKITGRS